MLKLKFNWTSRHFYLITWESCIMMSFKRFIWGKGFLSSFLASFLPSVCPSLSLKTFTGEVVLRCSLILSAKVLKTRENIFNTYNFFVFFIIVKMVGILFALHISGKSLLEQIIRKLVHSLDLHYCGNFSIKTYELSVREGLKIMPI